MNTQIHDITFESDGYKLKGMLHLPDCEKPAVIIGSHGLQSDGRSPKQIALAKESNRIGMAYFRFHHRGCGESQGVFEKDTSLDARCRDVQSAVRCMLNHALTGSRIGLFGSSMGGAACMAAAGDLPVSALVTLAAPVSSASIFKHIEKSGLASEFPAFFYAAHLQFDLSALLPALHHILIFHGDQDQVVPFSDARRIYEKAARPKKLIVQEGGDHGVSNPADQKQFVEETVAWFRKYLL